MRTLHTNLDIEVPEGALFLYNQYDKNNITGEPAIQEARDMCTGLKLYKSYIKHFEEDLSVPHNGHIVVLAHSNGKTIRALQKKGARWDASTFVNKMDAQGLFKRRVLRFYLIACNASDSFGPNLYRAIHNGKLRNHPAEVLAPNGTAYVNANGSVGVNRSFWMCCLSCFCCGYSWTLYTSDKVKDITEEELSLVHNDAMNQVEEMV